MTVYVKNVEGLILPHKANSTDAGYDVIATSEPKIVGRQFTIPATAIAAEQVRYSSIDYIEYETNLAIAPESKWWVEPGTLKKVKEAEKFHTLCHPRSSISKYNLVLANSIGLVDQGYRNNVLFRFKYIVQPEDLILMNSFNIWCKVNKEKIYKRGDRIGQLLLARTIDMDFTVVDELPSSDRGLGGFGSSGL